MTPAEEYANKVLSGEIIAGKYIKLAAQRFIDDLKRKDIYLDVEAAERAIKFRQNVLVHPKGKWKGKPLIPALFQKFRLYNLYGWKYKDTDKLRFNSSYTQVSRKNAKSTDAAADVNTELFIGADLSPEILIGANNDEQAKITTSLAGLMIEQSPVLRKMILKPGQRGNGVKIHYYEHNVKSIIYRNSKHNRYGFMIPMNKKADTKDGFNPSLFYIDEYHEAKEDKLKEVAESGQGARDNPRGHVITTAGYNKFGPCFQNERRISIDILEGIADDDNHFTLIYEMDPGDDWKDELNWFKCNPLMYHKEHNPDPSCSDTIYPYLKIQFNKAKNIGGTKLTGFLTKNLNIWTDAPDIWIEDEDYMKNHTVGNTIDELEGMECYAGLDLAATKDINALVLFFPDYKGQKAILPFFWIPEKKYKDNQDKVDYSKWKQDGYIYVTDGPVVDHRYVINKIISLKSTYDIKYIGYDPYLATHGVLQELEDANFKTFEVPQRHSRMSEATKDIDRDILTARVEHFNNPIMRWMMANVVIDSDPNGNIKPDKKKSINKIDGVVAWVNAVAAYKDKHKEKEVEPRVDLW